MSKPRKFTAKRLNAWHRRNLKADRNVGPRFACADGFEVSIQASSGHYCSPREDRAWPYGAFELGYPTETEDVLRQYAEDKDGDLKSTVFGWVPVDVIVDLINKHGGPK